MEGNTAREFTRLWSALTHVQLAAHGFLSHLHDVGLSALAAAIIMLGVVILLELRSVAKLRHMTGRSLERVFEQLDLLRFETQQLLEERRESRESGIRRNAAVEYAVPARSQTAAAPATAVPAALSAPRAPSPSAAPSLSAASGHPTIPILPGARVAEPAAGAAARELGERRNLSSGEARLLSSLAEARARRTGLAEAVRA